MQITIRTFLVCSLVFSFHSNLFSQTDTLRKAAALLEKTIKDGTVSLSGIDRITAKYLNRLARQETRLKRKLAKKDSTAAARLFGKAQSKYQEIQQSFLNSKGKINRYKQYVPGLDSLKTSLSFLSENNTLLKDQLQNVQSALNKVKQLEDKLQQAEYVKDFIRQRKQFLNEQFEQMNMLKELKQYNKQAYYYAAQLKEYKNLLNEPDRLQAKAISLLGQLPAFQSFFKSHSQLAGLFSLPRNYEPGGSLAGLQTRYDIQQQLQQRIAAGGPNAQAAGLESMRQAQSKLEELKDKLNKLGGNPDMDMPQDFKPNGQRTKSFWGRLEYGTNLQTQRANYFYPTTSDMGLSVGYKLNDKSVIGIGGSYKVGWGTGWNNIRLSHEGASLRSFLDYKLKGSFFASGGFEYNYQPATDSINVHAPAAWTRSGLIGITKIVSLKGKIFKKTKLQLLWDFLSYGQAPRTQPVKFRIGYAF